MEKIKNTKKNNIYNLFDGHLCKLLVSAMETNIIFFTFLFYLFIWERGREGEREGEKHQCVVASHTPPTRDLAHNPGMCPNWELNQQPFGSQALHSIHWAIPARAKYHFLE